MFMGITSEFIEGVSDRLTLYVDPIESDFIVEPVQYLAPECTRASMALTIITATTDESHETMPMIRPVCDRSCPSPVGSADGQDYRNDDTSS